MRMPHAAVVLGLLSGSACAQELLITNVGDDSVRRYALDGTYLGDLVSPGAGGLNDPLGMTVAEDGRVFVSGDLSGRVHIYDGQTGESIGSLDTFGLRGPAGLKIRDGLLYVSDGRSGSVFRFNVETGDFVDRFISGLVVPEGLVWTADGSEIIVGDWWTNRLAVFDAQTGEFKRNIVTAGQGLTRPLHIELGTNGDTVLAANLFADVITEHSIATGELVRTIDLTAGGAPLDGPVDWQTLPDGTHIVSGSTSDNVLRYDAEWNYLGVWASGLGMDNPSAIHYIVPAPATGAMIGLSSVLLLKRRRSRS